MGLDLKDFDKINELIKKLNDPNYFMERKEITEMLLLLLKAAYGDGPYPNG